MSLVITGPFLPRKASQSLRDQIIDHLSDQTPSVGSPFFSDTQLMQMSGLSRKAVRRALDDLQREGWIDRVVGKGSFVGPRVLRGRRGASAAAVETITAGNQRDESNARMDALAGSTDAPTPGDRDVIRLAVQVHLRYGSAYDYFTRGIIEGLDRVAVDHRVVIELIGDYSSEMSAIAARLTQSRPDALLLMPATSRHGFVVGEAERLRIATILAGSHMLDADLPAVCDDGTQGSHLAVQHLHEHGHRRIGMLLPMAPAAWAHQRRTGFMNGLADCGLEPDERLVLWTPYRTVDGNTERYGNDRINDAEQIRQFVERHKLTALVLGCSGQHSEAVAQYVEQANIRLGRELSLVCFDQNYIDYEFCFGIRPTVVALPLWEMGARIATLARSVIERRPFERRQMVPCSIIKGESVATIDPS